MKRKVYTSWEEFAAQNATLESPLAAQEDLSPLAQSLTVGAHTLPNRLACQAMEGCDGTPTGEPGELTFRRYRRLAAGGAGLIWLEATACCEEGRANPRQLWLRRDNADAFRRLLDEIRETAVRAGNAAPTVVLQDTHSGRYAKPHGKPEPLIAYHNPLFEQDAPIADERVVTDVYLDEVKDRMIDTAVLAAEVGFDGVDIKCCHRYLNSELLSAYTRRDSRYGGSYENRTRLLREAVEGAVAACPSDFLVATRLNIYDGFPYPFGWGVTRTPAGSLTPDLTEPIRLVGELAERGVKLVNITMGNPYVNPHVNRPFAAGGYTEPEHPLAGVARMLQGIAAVQRAVPQVAVVSSAMSYLGAAAPAVAAAGVAGGDYAVAGFGRLTFADPDFARQILRDGKPDPRQSCVCCSKCTELMRSGSTPGCVVRDPLYTDLYRQLKTAKEA